MKCRISPETQLNKAQLHCLEKLVNEEVFKKTALVENLLLEVFAIKLHDAGFGAKRLTALFDDVKEGFEWIYKNIDTPEQIDVQLDKALKEIKGFDISPYLNSKEEQK